MKKIFFTMLLILSFVSGVNAKTYYVDENITDIEPKMNDIIILTLKENPSTGYKWEILFSDESKLTVVKDRFIASKADMPGAPGEREFKLKVVDYGSVSIMAAYVRPWEKDKVAKTYTLNINIE